MNSPVVGMSTKTKPAITPGRLSGSVTRQNVAARLAPRSAAASWSRWSMFSSTTKIGSETNGIQV